jgi:ComF family protein
MHFLRPLLAAIPTRKLLPGVCALCGALDDGLLCSPCRSRYLGDTTPRCVRCALPTSAAQRQCSRCDATPPAFDASFTAASYGPPMDALVQALKFGGQLPLAAAFARLLLAAVQRELVMDAHVMIAVPLSAERLVMRGFNQAHEIAKPLARAWQLPLCTDACVRIRDTEPQSALAMDRRRDNMRGAFVVARREAVAGKHVLVVDDVMTTGHTLDALAGCLKRHGATRVTNIVFSRTPPR